MSRDLLEEQIAYYRARAGEYDDWWLRRGRYDRGAEFNQRWFSEAELVRTALREFQPSGRVLELACGTGLWTEELLRLGADLTAVDASPEVLELNRQRLRGASVRYRQLDLFAWEPDGEFDCVFIGFFLSHVPAERLDVFLDKVRRSVRAGGRLFLVDSLFDPASTATDHQLLDKGQNWQVRRLSDGREFKVVKVFYSPEELQATLARAGFTVAVRTAGSFFLYASGEKAAE